MTPIYNSLLQIKTKLMSLRMRYLKLYVSKNILLTYPRKHNVPSVSGHVIQAGGDKGFYLRINRP